MGSICLDYDWLLKSGWNSSVALTPPPCCTVGRAGKELDDGWPESEKDVFQAAPRMVVVKDSR